MIARFTILLPYAFTLPASTELEPFEFDYHGYRATIHPPSQAQLNPADADASSPVPPIEVVERLRTADRQDHTDAVTVNQSPTRRANMLQIDVRKDEFDRIMPAPQGPEQGDPPVSLLLELSNKVLAWIRAVTGANNVKPVTIDRAWWRLRYLTDTGEELPPQQGLIRGRMATPLSWQIVVLDEVAWRDTVDLAPDYTPPTWDVLLLDAEAMLPEVGPSLVVALAALETLAAKALDTLAAASPVPPELWEWINDRDDYRKEPSLEEQLDVLLHVLAGRSLKDEIRLWEAFKNLRTARNQYVHEGVARVGGQEVTEAAASTLIAATKEIAKWVEVLLPRAMRRPRSERSLRVQITKQLSRSAAPQ